MHIYILCVCVWRSYIVGRICLAFLTLGNCYNIFHPSYVLYQDDDEDEDDEDE